MSTTIERQATFDYDALDDDTRQIVERKTEEIRVRIRRAAEDIVEIGRGLVEVKGRLGHGRFGEWLAAEFSWTDRTALNFMRVAEAFKSEIISDLRVAPTALYMLSAPSVPEEARREAVKVATNGHVGPAEAKAIIVKHKPAPPPRVVLEADDEPAEFPVDQQPEYEDESQDEPEAEDDPEEPEEGEEFELEPAPKPAPKPAASTPKAGPIIALGGKPAFPPKEGEKRPWAGWESIIGDLYGVRQFVREQGGIEGSVAGWSAEDKKKLATRLRAVVAEVNSDMDRWIPWLGRG